MNIANKDFEYALKLIKKNKVKRFYEKFSFKDLELLYEVGAVNDKKYMKFYRYYFHKIIISTSSAPFNLFSMTYKTFFKSVSYDTK